MISKAFLARAFFALALALGLAACKETPADKTSFTGGGIVKVLNVNIVPSTDSSSAIGGGRVTYLLARIEITNDQQFDWAPDLSHVYLLDRLQNRYAAITSGTTAVLGVNNDPGTLKKGDKRAYTVAFRVTDPNTTGTIGYDY